VAWLNPDRMDVRDLAHAIDDGDITEMSFAFTIPSGGGTWSDDYSQFRIDQFDLDRGDVSAVNYGANPYTSIAARARQVLTDVDHLPLGAARAAMDRLTARLSTQTPAPVVPEPARDQPAPDALAGRSVALVRAMLRADD